jgi:hypothetical protein
MSDDDATVRLPPTPAAAPLAAFVAIPAARRGLSRRAVAAGLGAVATGGGAWWWLRSGQPALPVALSAVPMLDEAGVLAHRAAAPRMLRMRDLPEVFVLDFPSLAQQGAALNRMAALVEKAGLPRDRILSGAELADAIARAGDTLETWYYGHNYRGSDLERFFRLATRDGVALSAEEEWLQGQFRKARAAVPAQQEIALISIAALGPGLDAEARASIFRHELGHGIFATRPDYAAHIRRIWREGFTAEERAAFRAFLGREGYDTANEELMIDEAQAYLLHTPDARFFDASHLGGPAMQVERLRALMRNGAPGGR